MAACFPAVALFMLGSGIAIGSGLPDTAAKQMPELAVVSLEVALAELEAGNPSFLDGRLGDARVLAFGEAEHEVHEALVLRNRIFQYLVENHGFTAFVAETGFLAGFVVDDYISGARAAPPRAQAIAAMWSFEGGELMQENLELLEWMRVWNEKSKSGRKLRFYGINPLAGASIAQLCRHALGYLKIVDAEQAEAFVERLSLHLSRFYAKPYAPLAPGERASFLVVMADLIAIFERHHVEWVERTGSLDYHRAYASAINARAADAMLQSRDPLRSQRDAIFAANVRWAMEREGYSGRIFLFAHAGHVSKGPGRNSDGRIRLPYYASMGQHLDEILHGDLVVLGSALGEEMQGLGLRQSLCSPRLLETTAKQRYATKNLIGYNPANPWFFDAGDSFDALICLDAHTPARRYWVP